MLFDPHVQPYASNRFCVTARKGMVATGSNLASATGLEILKKGGNAIDAAIATAACLTVVEPTANGLGSDAFALVWVKDKLYGLNASGVAPKNISIEAVKKQHDKMPTFGWTPVMVPGAVSGWVELHKRFGKLDFKEVLKPAIDYAENGYPLSPMLAQMFERATKRYKELFQDDPVYQEWFRVFTKENKESHHFGDMIYLKDHAKTLRQIADTYGEAFYRGELAEKLVAQSNRDHGYFSIEDMNHYHAEWVEPISVNYHGYDVWEIPPNGQGLVALMALNILNHFEPTHRDDVKMIHRQLEAMKMAFADGKFMISDPKDMKHEVSKVLSADYGLRRSQQISDIAQDPEIDQPFKSGTVYLCTADEEGNMVSFIQSNYMGFGSGIVVEKTGIALQNRGADFSLNPSDVNCLQPGKKSYHTIIPGFITKDGKAIGPFGVMGGYMQPQGHVQVCMNMIDFHLNPQMALDAPRWQWMEGKKFLFEPQFSPHIIEQLINQGHQIEIATSRVSFGRGQMIVRLENGVLVGGTESRTDSNIACY